MPYVTIGSPSNYNFLSYYIGEPATTAHSRTSDRLQPHVLPQLHQLQSQQRPQSVDNDNFLLYLRPSYDRALIDVILDYKWPKIFYVYDNFEGEWMMYCMVFCIVWCLYCVGGILYCMMFVLCWWYFVLYAVCIVLVVFCTVWCLYCVGGILYCMMFVLCWWYFVLYDVCIVLVVFCIVWCFYCVVVFCILWCL